MRASLWGPTSRNGGCFTHIGEYTGWTFQVMPVVIFLSPNERTRHHNTIITGESKYFMIQLVYCTSFQKHYTRYLELKSVIFLQSEQEHIPNSNLRTILEPCTSFGHRSHPKHVHSILKKRSDLAATLEVLLNVVVVQDPPNPNWNVGLKDGYLGAHPQSRHLGGSSWRDYQCKGLMMAHVKHVGEGAAGFHSHHDCRSSYGVVQPTHCKNHRPLFKCHKRW